MSYRSDRARRRATRRRNQRILIGTVIVLLLAAIGFFAYRAATGGAQQATPTPAAQGAVGETVTTASGLQYEELALGSGKAAAVGDTVVVHYTGWLEDGTQFDSSLDSGQPFPVTLGQGRVIPGWEEGLQGMMTGGKRRLTIPPGLAYGQSGRPPAIPENATLIFEVELLEIQ